MHHTQSKLLQVVSSVVFLISLIIEKKTSCSVTQSEIGKPRHAISTTTTSCSVTPSKVGKAKLVAPHIHVQCTCTNSTEVKISLGTSLVVDSSPLFVV